MAAAGDRALSDRPRAVTTVSGSEVARAGFPVALPVGYSSAALAAWVPARRPENTQSAMDSPLT